MQLLPRHGPSADDKRTRVPPVHEDSADDGDDEADDKNDQGRYEAKRGIDVDRCAVALGPKVKDEPGGAQLPFAWRANALASVIVPLHVAAQAFPPSLDVGALAPACFVIKDFSTSCTLFRANGAGARALFVLLHLDVAAEGRVEAVLVLVHHHHDGHSPSPLAHRHAVQARLNAVPATPFDADDAGDDFGHFVGRDRHVGHVFCQVDQLGLRLASHLGPENVVHL